MSNPIKCIYQENIYPVRIMFNIFDIKANLNISYIINTETFGHHIKAIMDFAQKNKIELRYKNFILASYGLIWQNPIKDSKLIIYDSISSLIVNKIICDNCKKNIYPTDITINESDKESIYDHFIKDKKKITLVTKIDDIIRDKTILINTITAYFINIIINKMKELETTLIINKLNHEIIDYKITTNENDYLHMIEQMIQKDPKLKNINFGGFI